MLLPMSTINTDFVATNKLLYGAPKIGKSTFASLMKDSQGRVPLFIASEDGHSSLQVSRAKITTGWDGFLKCIDMLEQNKARLQAEHSCIVLDLASDFDAWASSYVAKQKNVEYVGDLDQGKGWKLLRDQIAATFSRILALMPVVFVAHEQDKRIMWNGEQITTKAPSFSKAALEFVNGKVDSIIYFIPANSKKEFPELTMQQQSGWIAGCRQKSMCRTYKFDPANPAATYAEMCALYTQAQQALITQAAAPAPAAQQPAPAQA